MTSQGSGRNGHRKTGPIWDNERGGKHLERGGKWAWETNVLVDLLRIPARDGVILDAMLQRPEKGVKNTTDIDVVCFIHGTGGNFYSSTLFDFLGQKFLDRGCAVLRANTRGHDGMSTSVGPKGGVRLGAAYEVVDDCRHDLLGLTTWLRENIGARVALLGHSLGAVKCLYASSHETSLSPSHLILLSPPRLSYEWFCLGPKREEFLATYQQAEALVRQGQPLALMEVKIPLPFVITASGYVEKYGPDERYHYVKYLPATTIPSLFLFGSIEVENNPAFQGSPELIEQKRTRKPNMHIQVIPGGDHFYTGVRDPAWSAIENWLEGVRSEE